MSSPSIAGLDERFQLAQVVAQEAGKLAFHYFNERDTLVIETKRDLQDVVSIADREVEELIRSRFAEAFPGDGVLGEEYGLQGGNSGFTWVVDPIDGTSPFVNGMPNWCVSIALLHGGNPVVGVIYAPCFDETYAARAGGGATLNGRPLSLSPDKTIRNSVTGIGANSHVTPAFVARMVESLLEAGGNFIRNGSGALMLAYVAAAPRRLLRTLYACLGLPCRLLPREGSGRLVPSIPDRGRTADQGRTGDCRRAGRA